MKRKRRHAHLDCPHCGPKSFGAHRDYCPLVIIQRLRDANKRIDMLEAVLAADAAAKRITTTEDGVT